MAVCRDHWRFSPARRDRVDANAVRCILHRDDPGQALHPVLGSSVGTHASRSRQSGDGSRVHDRSTTTALDQRDLVLHPEKDTLEIDCDDPLKVFQWIIFNPFCRAGYPGIVEGRVEPTECGIDLFDPSDDLKFARDIELGCECPAIFGADELCRLGETLGVAISQMHCRAVASESKCYRPTDPRACTGDRDDLV
ncbi:hypothetical protein D3C80_1542900 [compost metagenome]